MMRLFAGLIVCVVAYCTGCGAKLDLTKNLIPPGEKITSDIVDTENGQYAFGGNYILGKDGRKNHVIIVCPIDQAKEYQTVLGYKTVTGRQTYEFTAAIKFRYGKPISVLPNSVCFFDNGKLIVCKTLQALDIDEKNSNDDLNPANLRPVLEKLIRENVKPPTHETEE